MTHDPLCRFSRKRAADDKYDDCEYCDLIAKARAEERWATVESAVPDAPWDTAPWLAYRQALRDLPDNTADPRQAVWPEQP